LFRLDYLETDLFECDSSVKYQRPISGYGNEIIMDEFELRMI